MQLEVIGINDGPTGLGPVLGPVLGLVLGPLVFLLQITCTQPKPVPVLEQNPGTVPDPGTRNCDWGTSPRTSPVLGRPGLVPATIQAGPGIESWCDRWAHFKLLWCHLKPLQTPASSNGTNRPVRLLTDELPDFSVNPCGSESPIAPDWDQPGQGPKSRSLPATGPGQLSASGGPVQGDPGRGDCSRANSK